MPHLSCLYIFDATIIGTRISLFVFEGRPDGPFDPAVARSSELLGSNPGRMLVIKVVPIHCSKLFKGMECAVMSMALCTIKNP